jgi:hypothetical protein
MFWALKQRFYYVDILAYFGYFLWTLGEILLNYLVALALVANIRVAWNGLSGPNTLAYSVSWPEMEKRFYNIDYYRCQCFKTFFFITNDVAR